MYEYLKPGVKQMQKLASHKWFVPLLKRLMPIKFKYKCGYGWKITYPSSPKNRFSMTTHKCIFNQIFTKYNMPEMTLGFCKVDNLLHAKFYYSQRIGEKGKFCDYSFERE